MSKRYKLEDFTRGWIVGDFEPSIIRTKACDVQVRKWEKNTYHEPHYHATLDEIMVIIEGKAEINGEIFEGGDISVMEKNDVCYFQPLTDVTSVCIKMPSGPNDKHYVEDKRQTQR